MRDPHDFVWTMLAQASIVVGWLLPALVVTVLVGGPRWVVPVFVGLCGVELVLVGSVTYRMRARRP